MRTITSGDPLDAAAPGRGRSYVARVRHPNPIEKDDRMADPPEVGCARPTGGPVGEPVDAPMQDSSPAQKETRSMIQVGQKAPDFVSPAYHNGKFTTEKLSDHLGKWTVLCFYPGDFTFV
jgi:peroxiredoxin (alkyl hydroperoxide reductase subunit C)